MSCLGRQFQIEFFGTLVLLYQFLVLLCIRKLFFPLSGELCFLLFVRAYVCSFGYMEAAFESMSLLEEEEELLVFDPEGEDDASLLVDSLPISR